jgi:uncharacterized protein (DUF952 family)
MKVGKIIQFLVQASILGENVKYENKVETQFFPSIDITLP